MSCSPAHRSAARSPPAWYSSSASSTRENRSTRCAAGSCPSRMGAFGVVSSRTSRTKRAVSTLSPTRSSPGTPSTSPKCFAGSVPRPTRSTTTRSPTCRRTCTPMSTSTGSTGSTSTAYRPVSFGPFVSRRWEPFALVSVPLLTDTSPSDTINSATQKWRLRYRVAVS